MAAKERERGTMGTHRGLGFDGLKKKPLILVLLLLLLLLLLTMMMMAMATVKTARERWKGSCF
jgi:hypothetical protein